jgi:hypothetical protein
MAASCEAGNRRSGGVLREETMELIYFFPYLTDLWFSIKSKMPFHYRRLDLAGTPPPGFGVPDTVKIAYTFSGCAKA